MKTLSKNLTVVAAAISLFALSSSSASALVIEQSQELHNSVKTNVSCTGDCSATAEASQSAKQRQYVEVPAIKTVRYTRAAHGKVVWMPTTSVVMMPEGQVRLSWAVRGETCHVRYSESAQKVWKYQTAAGCDEGSLTIGGLTSGTKYKFQVRQGNGAWSRIMYAIAR